MRVGRKLTAREFNELSNGLISDLEDAYIIIQESVLASVVNAIERGATREDIEQIVSSLYIEAAPETESELQQGIRRAVDFKKIMSKKAVKTAFKKISKKTGMIKGSALDMITRLVSSGASDITESVKSKTAEEFKQAAQGSTLFKRKKMVLPEINQVVPAALEQNVRSIEFATEITEDMKAGLLEDLKTVMDEEGVTAMTGPTAGQVKARLTEKFEKKVRNRFQKFVDADPRVGNPANLHSIAVTTVRSSINNIRRQYAEDFAKKNDLRSAKTWIHNPHLSKTKPREAHAQLNRTSVPINQKFYVNGNAAAGPHDPVLPLGERINCHCELLFEMLSL